MQVREKVPLACQVYALHGFLGKPSDWHAVFKGHPFQACLNAVDIFAADAILPFDAWAAKVTGEIGDEEKKSCRRVLIGYSLGGRLALHLALHQPHAWDAVVIISAHSGIPSEEDRLNRQIQDDLWAQRFETDPWNILMQAWNSREVFQKDSFAFECHESDYKRYLLAAALRCWSLGNQKDLLSQLSKISCPVLWVAGAEDKTYAMQAELIQKKGCLRHPRSYVWLAPECGHRVPWQRTDRFIFQLNRFLKDFDC